MSLKPGSLRWGLCQRRCHHNCLSFWQLLLLTTRSPTFFFLLRSPSHAHRTGFQLRRTKQWQLGVGRHEGVRRCAVDAHKRHLLAPRSAARVLSGRRAGWKQWIPSDKVQQLQSVNTPPFRSADFYRRPVMECVKYLHMLKKKDPKGLCWQPHVAAPHCIMIGLEFIFLNICTILFHHLSKITALVFSKNLKK